MIGPTGVGKTEIARRLAKLAQAPFVKVEASKFTEVGYVGRDVESIIRDLAELGVNLVAEEERRAVQVKAEERAEERRARRAAAAAFRHRAAGGDGPEGGETREKLRRLLRAGRPRRAARSRWSSPRERVRRSSRSSRPRASRRWESSSRTCSAGLMPKKTKRRRLKVPAAREAFVAEEAARLVDMDRGARARDRARRADRDRLHRRDRQDRERGRAASTGPTSRARACSATCCRSSRARRSRRSTAPCAPTTSSSSRPARSTWRSRRI